MLELSTLDKTWIIDVDGTIVKHNGYKIDGFDTLLEGVREFFESLPEGDKVILLTARKQEFLPALKLFLNENHIRYDYLLTDMPTGERILINDAKPSGLNTAFALNKIRDAAFMVDYRVDEIL